MYVRVSEERRTAFLCLLSSSYLNLRENDVVIMVLVLLDFLWCMHAALALVLNVAAAEQDLPLCFDLNDFSSSMYFVSCSEQSASEEI